MARKVPAVRRRMRMSYDPVRGEWGKVNWGRVRGSLQKSPSPAVVFASGASNTVIADKEERASQSSQILPPLNRRPLSSKTPEGLLLPWIVLLRRVENTL